MTEFKRKRQKQNNIPNAILTSDWHLRESTPQCRTDNFWKAQEKKVDFILALSRKHNAPIFIAGDIGHISKWSCKLLEWAINKFKDIKIFVIAGQHDLPQHQLSQWPQSGIGVLHAAGAVEFIQTPKIINNKFMIYPFSYNEEIITPEKNESDLPKIAMVHQMIVESKDLFPNQSALRGHQLLKKFPQFSIILSGDNHNSFIINTSDNILCNPGSFMRSTTAQIDHKPRVYLWYAQDNIVEPVYLPIEQGVISREHIEVTEQRNTRMDAYMERMKNDIEIELSFEKNLESYFDKNRIQPLVVEKVWNHIN